jgi:hypothetical protein
MKSKTSFVVLVGLGLVALSFRRSAFGQGSFSFMNAPETLVRVSYTVGVSSPATDAKVEILWAPVGTTDLFLFQPVPGASPVAVGAVVAGRFFGGTRTIPAGSGFSGIAPGATVAAFIRGWTGPANSWFEFQTSSTGLFGYSPIFTIDTADPTTAPPEPPVNISSSTLMPFTGLTLTYLPEPSSAALFLIGGGWFCWRRRVSLP